MTYAQNFIDTLDRFEGTNAYRQRVKQTGKAFKVEVEKFLNAAWCGGDTELNVIELIDKCQVASEKKVEEILDNDVDVV